MVYKNIRTGAVRISNSVISSPDYVLVENKVTPKKEAPKVEPPKEEPKMDEPIKAEPPKKAVPKRQNQHLKREGQENESAICNSR